MEPILYKHKSIKLKEDIHIKILGVFFGVLVIIGGIFWIYKEPRETILALIVIGAGWAIIDEAIRN